MFKTKTSFYTEVMVKGKLMYLHRHGFVANTNLKRRKHHKKVIFWKINHFGSSQKIWISVDKWIRWYGYVLTFKLLICLGSILSQKLVSPWIQNARNVGQMFQFILKLRKSAIIMRLSDSRLFSVLSSWVNGLITSVIE